METTLLPQLLKPIDEKEIDKYLSDRRYGAQEKKDGKRMFVQTLALIHTKAFNRKGISVDVPDCFVEAGIHFAARNKFNNYLFDGEKVGEKFYIFDSLQLGSKYIRNLPYKERYAILQIQLMEKPFELLPLAITTKDKRALYKRLKKEGKEGIVFKRLDAPYTPGRSTTQVKCKFYSTASFIVTKINSKRSVGVSLYKGSKLVDHGNCTVPPNFKMPAIDDIVEIRMLYAYKDGCLCQPVYLGERDDIYEEDCTTKQLRYKNENNN